MATKYQVGLYTSPGYSQMCRPLGVFQTYLWILDFHKVKIKCCHREEGREGRGGGGQRVVRSRYYMERDQSYLPKIAIGMRVSGPWKTSRPIYNHTTIRLRSMLKVQIQTKC